MTADEVIALRKVYDRMNYAGVIPEATVLAQRDWLAYVRAMMATIPTDETLVMATEEEVGWAWPEGVLIVFEEPVEVGQVIISKGDEYGRVTRTAPHIERQTMAAMAIQKMQLVRAQDETGAPFEEGVAAHGCLYLGVDPADAVTGWWMPGAPLKTVEETGPAESTNFLISIITALGHRLTRVGELAAGRAERRRAARGIPGGLRVLQLHSGATARSSESSSIEWSHRWMVRGHWRLQPYGPQRSKRRLQWIDPFVKGPEDKPLDVRPTIWKTGEVA